MDVSFPSSVFSKTFGQDDRDSYCNGGQIAGRRKQQQQQDSLYKQTTTSTSASRLTPDPEFGTSATANIDESDELFSCGSSFDEAEETTDAFRNCNHNNVFHNKNNNNNNKDFNYGGKQLQSSSNNSISTISMSINSHHNNTDNNNSTPQLSFGTAKATATATQSTGVPQPPQHTFSNLVVSDDDEKKDEEEIYTKTRKTKTKTEIDELSAQMGKLWWTESNQDISKKYERDKYGRLLIPDEERLGGRSTTAAANGLSAATSNSATASGGGNSSGSGSDDEGLFVWYNKVIASVYNVADNWWGDTDGKSKPPKFEELEGMDEKLETSMAMANSVDKVWAKELYEMDANEREDIINEIHGVKSKRAVSETPRTIAEGLSNLREYIEFNLDKPLDNEDSIVPPVTKEPYKKAVYELKSLHIQSDAFLLRFLRASLYQIDKAALRYFRYLDLLVELFGDVALTRPLSLNDLTKRELRYLKKGQMQLLPSRDRAGRRMYAFSGCDDWNYNIREKYRTNVYLIDVLSEDETSQKLGVVSLHAPRVGTGNNPFGFEGMTLRMGKQELLGGKFTEPEFFRKINEALPFRLTGIHYFAPNTIIYNIGKAMILLLLGKEDRKIVRFHAGSQLECDYSLRSFGIPHEDITITDGGNIKTKNVQRFINARRSIELYRAKQHAIKHNHNDECPGIECPEVDCIVFGDKTLNGHPANLEFRDILKTMEREREEKSTRSEEIPAVKDFIDSIIRRVRERNLRFVAMDRANHLFLFVEDHNELSKRVSQALRDQRKRCRLEQARFIAKKLEPSSSCVVENSSIMGKDATKRLKREDRSCISVICTRS